MQLLDEHHRSRTPDTTRRMRAALQMFADRCVYRHRRRPVWLSRSALRSVVENELDEAIRNLPADLTADEVGPHVEAEIEAGIMPLMVKSPTRNPVIKFGYTEDDEIVADAYEHLPNDDDEGGIESLFAVARNKTEQQLILDLWFEVPLKTIREARGHRNPDISRIITSLRGRV